MSTVCPEKKSCIDTTTCPSQFKGKNCKCVTTRTVKRGAEYNKCDAIGTTCAYEEDGVLYACSVGCCQNQCPGQCPEESSEAPMSLGKAVLTSDTTRRWALAIIVLLIALLIISTIDLF